MRLPWGADDDVLVGRGGSDRLRGGEGDDELYGGDEFVNIGLGHNPAMRQYEEELSERREFNAEGGWNNVADYEEFYYQFYGDFNDSDASRDYLYGEGGLDLIVGGGGNDYIVGGEGADWMFGGEGRDSIYGQNGHDVIFGGDGRDYLSGGNGHDAIWGGEEDDRIFGGSGNDALTGGRGNDFLDGGVGADQLTGGGYLLDGGEVEGNDIDFLFGGRDNDVDSLWGGRGTDFFMLYGSGYDRVVDRYLYGSSENDIYMGYSQWAYSYYYRYWYNTVHRMNS